MDSLHFIVKDQVYSGDTVYKSYLGPFCTVVSSYLPVNIYDR